MTQIIKTSTPGKERAHFGKAIVITIREFMRQKGPDENTNDMVAFIILALEEISAGIDKSVAAWEKRGYWVKADKYRMEWAWAEPQAKLLRQSFAARNWPSIAGHLVKIMAHFSEIKVSNKHRMGQPWVGAFKEFNKLQE